LTDKGLFESSKPIQIFVDSNYIIASISKGQGVGVANYCNGTRNASPGRKGNQ
jgi:hypothetical protein